MLRHYYYGPPVVSGGPGTILFALIVPVIFWALVIWLIVSLVRHGRHYSWHYGHTHEAENPLELAKARYAKGEITKTEFEQLKKDLKD